MFAGSAEQIRECWSVDVTSNSLSRVCVPQAKSQVPMNLLSQPRREFLADQVAAILRREITAGRWSGWLPGERALSRTLNVSRPTLRAALQQLVAAREIAVHSRDGYAIARKKSPVVRMNGNASHALGLICPAEIYSMPSHVVQLVDGSAGQWQDDSGDHEEVLQGAGEASHRRSWR